MFESSFIVLYFAIFINKAMSTNPEQNKNALVRAIECKSKSKINIEEFLAIVQSDANLTSINERGLFLQYISELLLKAFLSFGLRMNGFTA